MSDSKDNKNNKEAAQTSDINRKGQDPQWKFTFLIDQFAKESDRAAVILVASLLDEALGTLLRTYLVPIANSKDPLFDDATSPFSSFSSKIDILHRIGLISSKLARDLHLIRRIRNSFAHDIYGCDFNNGSVMARVSELENSVAISKEINKILRNDNLLDGTRGMFLFISSMIIWYLNDMVQRINEIEEKPKEGMLYTPEAEK